MKVKVEDTIRFSAHNQIWISCMELNTGYYFLFVFFVFLVNFQSIEYNQIEDGLICHAVLHKKGFARKIFNISSFKITSILLAVEQFYVIKFLCRFEHRKLCDNRKKMWMILCTTWKYTGQSLAFRDKYLISTLNAHFHRISSEF